MPARWRFQTSQIGNVAIEVLWRPGDGERGGDFFEVLDLADGRVTVLLGTVPPAGGTAAVIADDNRYLLRRALHRATPVVRALTELDRHVSEMGVIGLKSSVLVIMVDARSGSALVVNAGHPPPLVLTEGGDTRFMDSAPDALIGTHGERTPVSVSMGPDSSLLAFTDGLIQRGRRPTVADDLSLLSEVARELNEPVGVLSLARGIVGQIGQPTHDATLVSIRRAPSPSLLTRSEELQEVC